MVIDKYTKHSIFSLPQIFSETFNKYDLKENEFVNMYVNDINSPNLSNHIFLVFHGIKQSLIDTLSKHSLFETTYSITKNKVKFIVFAFKRSFYVQSIVRDIDNGLYEFLGYNAKIKILNFWEAGINSKIHKYLFDSNTKTDRPLCENITLEDKK